MVNFDKKAQETRRAREEEEEEEEAPNAPSSSYSNAAEDDDDWIDYTDSFGRQRRCPRKDLAKYIEADLRLARAEVSSDRPSSSSTSNDYTDATDRGREEDDYYTPSVPSGPVHHTHVAYNGAFIYFSLK